MGCYILSTEALMQAIKPNKAGFARDSDIGIEGPTGLIASSLYIFSVVAQG